MAQSNDPMQGPPPEAIDTSGHGQVTGSGTERMYTTKEGDTLETIAAFFYGDSTHRRRLLEENPELNAGTPVLTAGMQIRVSEDPGQSDAVPSPA